MSPAGASPSRYRPSASRPFWPTAEQELILVAAIGPDADAAHAFERWGEITDFRDHFDVGVFRLLPFVYRRMHTLGVAGTTMPMLKGVYRYVWFSTQALFHGVAPTLSLLQANNIEMVLLKGAPLHETYYKGLGVRPMDGVDIAVRPEVAPTAIAFLETAGWKWMSPERNLEFHHELDFVNSEGRQLDLHFHFLVHACNVSADAWFWRHTTPFEFMGIRTRQLDPTAMLFHVVAHGVWPNTNPPIRWIVDAITILTRAENIRWSEIVEFAHAQRLTYGLHLGLSYLAEMYEAPIPPFVLNELRAANSSLTEWVEKAFVLDDEARASSISGRISLDCLGYARRSRDKDKLMFMVGLIAYARRRLWSFVKFVWEGRRQGLSGAAHSALRRLSLHV